MPLRFPALSRWIYILLATGIIARSVALLLLNVGPGPFARGLLGLSGLLEVAAVGLYVALLYLSVCRSEPRHQAIRAVRPYFLGALLGPPGRAVLARYGTLVVMELPGISGHPARIFQ